MEANQLREEFPPVQESIDAALQMCEFNVDVPEALREQLSELERTADRIRRMLSNQLDEADLLDALLRLHQLGERALEACHNAPGLDEPMWLSVQQIRQAISDLQHRLH